MRHRTLDRRTQRREIVGQVFDGAWGTNVRAGIIGEIGSQNPWTDLEKTVMRGAVIAQQETGYGPGSIIWGKTTRDIVPDLINTIEIMRDAATQETLTDASEHALAVCRQLLAREAYNERKALMWKEVKASK